MAAAAAVAEEQLIASAAPPRLPLQQVAPAQHNAGLFSPPVYPVAGEVGAITAQYGEWHGADGTASEASKLLTRLG